MKDREKLNSWILKQHGAELRDFDDFKMPWFWRKFAIDSVTLKGKYIYLRNADKLSETGFTALLFHEGFHVASQRSIGWTRYVLQYALSPDFRVKEEVESYLRQIEYWYVVVGMAAASDLANRVPDLLANGYVLKSHKTEIKNKITAGLFKIVDGTRRPVRKMLAEYNDENKIHENAIGDL